MKDKLELTRLIKTKISEAGFDLCGIAPVSKLEENSRVLREWCSAGMNAGMDYLSRNIEKRTDPQVILPGAKSVIITGINYFSERKQGGREVPILSIYAYGKDYHDVIREKLDPILQLISEEVPRSSCKSFIDSAPLFEKEWAVRAGLGWQGKHSIVINEKIGSFFFLGSILTTVELEYDGSQADRCGSCMKCIESCPAGAINGNRTIDARKCISYLTVDNREPVAEDDIPELGGRIFGCDRCQEVCPWNSKASPHDHPEFKLQEEVQQMDAIAWLDMTREDHKRLFRGTAVSRRKFEIFKQNVTNVTKSLRP